MSDWYYDRVQYPHGLTVKRIVQVETKILNPQGKMIMKNPEPIGFVAPASYQKYSVKE